MTGRDYFYLRLLLSVEGLGPVKIKNLVAASGSPDAVFSYGIRELATVEGISTQLARRISAAAKDSAAIEEVAAKDLEKALKYNISLISIWDREYPPLLKKIYDAPVLLYVLGNILPDDKHAVAVVGTRGPTAYGKEMAQRISGGLAEKGVTIVSGLARGVDSVAHRAALVAGGRTIAVLGSGMDKLYPPENRQLAEDIVRRGALVTEYHLGTKPDAVNFPKRNRIIAGLALGTVVVETGITGGALQTARFALDQNREVFAIPGNVGVKQSDGTNLIIQRSEARLVRNADDVLAELPLRGLQAAQPVKAEPPPDLNMFEAAIVHVLGKEPLQIDRIAQLTGLSVSDCLVYLLSLEFKNLVRQLPGKQFTAV